LVREGDWGCPRKGGKSFGFNRAFSFLTQKLIVGKKIKRYFAVPQQNVHGVGKPKSLHAIHHKFWATGGQKVRGDKQQKTRD